MYAMKVLKSRRSLGRLPHARGVALALMLFSALSQPLVALADLRPPACRELFVTNDEKAVLDVVLKGLLQGENVDVKRRPYKKFLRNLSRQEKIGRLEVAWLASRIADEKIKAELSEKHKGLDYLLKSYSPSAFMDQYFREQVINHGFIETLAKLGLLRDSGSVENFRSFLRQYDIGYLVSSLILTVPVAAVHGPLSFTVGLSLAGTPLPWLRAKPIPPEILMEAIEKGIPAVHSRLVERYGNRARVEAVQHVLELAVWALFFATIATYTEQYFPWIRFAAISLFAGPSDEDIARVHRKLGLDQRVDIQIESWANAYREFSGRPPTQAELDRKRREFHSVLGHL